MRRCMIEVDQVDISGPRNRFIDLVMDACGFGFDLDKDKEDFDELPCNIPFSMLTCLYDYCLGSYLFDLCYGLWIHLIFGLNSFIVDFWAQSADALFRTADTLAVVWQVDA
ncbi:hypothetical protein CFOL_v3_33128 [Cephalotus follicularis]|uniref:Uncharacterized protein n=1 Tax=Cephalotus follicularis TaxID=3775 RepID=A0A1Q3DB64_CEPFO|nr:hypothetical protein CFOL_v3_33128 [Cephalotus follicularis]